jgi:hypothetical protein
LCTLDRLRQRRSPATTFAINAHCQQIPVMEKIITAFTPPLVLDCRK